MALPIFQRTITDSAGDVIPSAQITVIDEATGVAPAGGIFSDRAGTVPLGAGGVFSTGADGFAQFYVARGAYRVTALNIGTGLSQTWRYVVLINSDVYAPDNILGIVSQSGGVPTGAWSETGSNASGDYTAYADGRLLMILTPISSVNITTSVGTGGVFNIASPLAVTTPYPMAGGACSGFVNDANSPNVWGGVDYISSTSVQVQALFYQSLSGRTIVPVIFARWY